MGARRDLPARVTALVLGSLGLLALVAHVWLELLDPWPSFIADTARVQALLSTPLGMLIVWRRPRLVAGWLLLLLGAANGAVTLVVTLHAPYLGSEPPDYPPVAAFFIGFRAYFTGYAAVMLPLVHPSSGLLARGWRWLYLAVTCWYALLLGLGLSRTDALIPASWRVDAMSGEPLVWASVLVLVARFWRGGPDTRRQIGWLLLALVFDTVFFADLLGWEYLWLDVLGEASVPVAVTVAILRYRLYAIDTLLSRAVLGFALLAAVASAYLVAGALAGLVLSGFGAVLGTLAAILAGVCFLPVLRALQRGLDQVLYGRSGDPRTHAEALRRQIRLVGAVEAMGPAVRAVAEGLAATGAAVRIDPGREGTPAVPEVHRFGDLGPAPGEYPLTWHGCPVGVLLVGPREATRFPRAYERRMLAALLPIVADLAHNLAVARELEHYRRRVAGAREEERRRLHRDLHDGLGSRLTGMAIALEAARRSVARSPELAHELLADLRRGVDVVTGEIRDLLDGTGPRALAAHGLEQAVRLLAEEARVTVSGSLDGLPGQVEVAAYRIVQEALANARRHARARTITVELGRLPAGLRVRVADDGVGCSPPKAVLQAGSGLRSMRERAAELGGGCTIGRGPRGGTVVEAFLPCPGDGLREPRALPPGRVRPAG
ncbi:histidine kinase [Nonomuraea sp. NPDC050328]|uniref:histidine kinase n=1 Tax=Nonomuraea sp. NPDC050328 TaxID=3364361 RepID=UPI0037AD4BEB